MHEQTKAVDIPKKVKEEVYERDAQVVGEGVCIICLGPGGIPNSHYIRRSQGGLGIPENVGTMCIHCHDAYDFGANGKREEIGKRFRDYLKARYPGWNEKDLVYSKWADFPL